MDLEKAKTTALHLAQGMVNYDPKAFEKGGKYALHATGKVDSTLVINASTLLGMAAAVPAVLKKGMKKYWRY